MRVIFAGGGTAGHIQPALAVARAWQMTYPDCEIEFIGTKFGLEGRLIPEAGFKVNMVAKVKVSRRLSLSLLYLPLTLLRSVLQARQILKGADLLVGFGGYVSGPAYLAARTLGIAYVIHEANARPGLANQLGALFTPFKAVATAVPNGPLSSAQILGLPLNPAVVSAYESAASDWAKARESARKKLGFSHGQPLIFIFGGSQGSQAINEVIAQALPELIGKEVQILHGVGALHTLPEARTGYLPVNYLDDMASAYLAADLIISRSGAVSCAEINTLGRYALFIPLPIGNGEQRLNASSLIAQSRAELIEQSNFTAEWLESNISRLLSKSAAAPTAGSDSDIVASVKLVALMERALTGGR
jgi:UDP-N-acetylglucosamine--N-acetylmuramyl-(pentapeptide) pyrophosphoryl-undecaprenol N-acetylglucosamine transferase